MNSPLKKNSPAPEFTAGAYDGRAISLDGLLRDGPVVLSFLRGFS